jgi:mannose-1-phosphate guanylyltransferase
VVLDEIARQQPDMHAQLERIAHASPDTRDTVTTEAFANMPSISFDYAIMEGAADVAIVPADMGWSDLGHWAALPEVRAADGSGNIVEGEAILEDVKDCTIWSEGGRTVAAVGVRDLVVVDTPDALLVVPRDRAQDVRAIVAALEATGRKDLR